MAKTTMGLNKESLIHTYLAELTYVLQMSSNAIVNPKNFDDRKR